LEYKVPANAADKNNADTYKNALQSDFHTKRSKYKWDPAFTAHFLVESQKCRKWKQPSITWQMQTTQVIRQAGCHLNPLSMTGCKTMPARE
jgi:hypothetical protein